MYKIKEYLSWQILLLILTNLLLADECIIGFILLMSASIVVIFSKNIFISGSIFLLAVLFCLCRIIYLPILYSLLEKKSNNVIILKFIYNLKNKKDMRKKILLILSILPSIFIAYCSIVGTSNIIECFIRFGILTVNYFLLFSLLGSYVVLFLWWWIRGELK